MAMAVWLLAFNLAHGGPVAASTPAVLNYQGRVSVDGKNFNGTADFVFSINDTNGVILWSSGNFPMVGATNLPLGVRGLMVRNGLYNIRLGDPGAGMPVLDADTLRNAGAPFLRVWFNDGVKGWRQLAGEEPLKSLFYPAPVRPGATTASGALSAAQGDMILRELRELRGLLQKQNPSQPSPKPEPPGIVTVPLGGSPSLGQTNAPLVLVEFTDYQCPFCKRAHDDWMPALRKKYVESGKLRVVSRNFPLNFHVNAEPAARAALCAHQQQQFWPMYDKLFSLAPELYATNFLKAAVELKLDPQAFTACLETKAVAAQIERDKLDAGTAGITGTPSFVLGRAAGEKVTGTLFVGAPPAAQFEAEIEKLLTQKRE
jgi:protein-disulfide isomerase